MLGTTFRDRVRVVRNVLISVRVQVALVVSTSLVRGASLIADVDSMFLLQLCDLSSLLASLQNASFLSFFDALAAVLALKSVHI